MNLHLGKKGQVMDKLSMLVVALVSVGLVLAIGFLILANIKSTVESDSLVVNSSADNWGALNATHQGMEDTINATATIPSFLDIIVITIIGALLLALVRRFRGEQ